MTDIQQPPWTFAGSGDSTLNDLSNALNVSTEQQVNNTLASTSAAMDGLISTLSNMQSVKFPSLSYTGLQDTTTQSTSIDAPGFVGWSYTPDMIQAVAIEYSKPTMDQLLAVPTSSDTPPVAPSIQYNAPSAPGIQGVSPTLPDFPDSIAVGSISSLSIGPAPTLTDSAPTISTPAVPSAFPGSAPVMDSLPDRQYPDALARSIPTAPVLRSFDLPSTPELLDIEFSGTLPNALDEPPNLSFNYSEVAYDSELLSALKVKLLDMVHNARQIGLNATIMQTIFDDGRLRSTSASNGLIGQVSRHFNRMGWGSNEYITEKLFEAQELLVATDMTETRSDNLILSDLEQKNFQFSIGKSVELEGQMIDLHNKVQQRSFEAAKAMITAAVSIYKLKASYFNTAVALYGAQAQAYKIRIQAELSKAELYKAQVEGQRLIGDLNTQAIDNYKAQIDAVVSLHGLYSAELEAVKTKLECDSLKIKQFEGAVDAFSVEIQAKELEYEGYKTAMTGEALKASIFDNLVSAYGAQIEGYSAGVDAQILKLDADIKANIEAPLQISGQDVKRFVAIVGAESQYLKALAKNDDAAIDVFSAMIDAEKSRVSNTAEMYSAEVEAFKAVNAGEGSRLKIISDINSTAADIYKSEVAAEVANIKSIAAIDSNKVDIIKALTQQDIASINIDVANQKADTNMSNTSVVSKAEIANAQVDANKSKATMAINKMEASLDIATTEINRSIEEKDTAIRTMTAAAQAQAQVIAANASTVNIHKGFTDSKSESTSVSVNSYSYSENDTTTIQG